jgi:molybdate transport system substrate-binding protein
VKNRHAEQGPHGILNGRKRVSQMRQAFSKAFIFTAFFLFIPHPLHAAEIRVMISGGFSAAYKQLVPKFEAKTGHKVETAFGPSMGDTPQAIPNRIARGEPADAVIMAAPALDDLIKKGKVEAGSRTGLAESSIGAAVREGAPKPDIGSVEAFKKTLLEARSIAYSDSASGVYISKELFPRLGLAEQMKDKARMIPAEPVGRVVARGEAELGFQQISELMPVSGIVILGPIPSELQKITVFGAGIVTGAKEPEAAKALIAYLSSGEVSEIVRSTGLKPLSAGTR